jgi:hypothetical protein
VARETDDEHASNSHRVQCLPSWVVTFFPVPCNVVTDHAHVQSTPRVYARTLSIFWKPKWVRKKIWNFWACSILATYWTELCICGWTSYLMMTVYCNIISPCLPWLKLWSMHEYMASRSARRNTGAIFERKSDHKNYFEILFRCTQKLEFFHSLHHINF